MDHNRLLYPDLLRIFAILAIILLHTASYGLYVLPISNLNWQAFNLYHTIGRWGVPVFFMMSGMFMLRQDANFETDGSNQYRKSYKKLFSKNISRMVCALVFWGLFHNLFSDWFYLGTITWHNILAAFSSIIHGPAWYHLWFLYTIISLYILSPLISIFTKYAGRKGIEIFLILFALFGSCLPFINQLLAMKGLTTFTFSMPEVCGYIGFFVAGYYFANYNISTKHKNIIYILGIIGFIITMFMTYLLSLRIGPNELFYQYLSPNILIFSLFVFLLFKNYSEKIKLFAIAKKMVSYLATCVFGIYLVHPLFLFLITAQTSFILNYPFITIPCIAITVFIISFATSAILNKIPFLNKYIV